GDNSNAFGTIHFHLLPYLEEGNLFQNTWDGARYHPYNPYPSAGNPKFGWNGTSHVNTSGVKTYVCPSDPNVNADGTSVIPTPAQFPWGAGCYGANFQVFAYPDHAWQFNAAIPTTFSDGT